MSVNKSSSSPLMTIKNELLHGAVVKGDLPTVRRLLDRHRADINTKNSNGLSMLQIALLNGHSKLSEYLIQKGVDIHATDEEGFSALHDAALKGDILLVRKLISKGLSPLLATNMGELVIDLAANLQVEKLMCEEMCKAGEIKLAREYSLYLGLERDMPGKPASRLLATRGCYSHFTRTSHAHPLQKVSHSHASLPKLEGKSAAFKTQFQVSKNMPTQAVRVHPSISSAESAENGPRPISDNTNCFRAKVGSLPNYNTGNHSNAKDVEVIEEPTSEVYKKTQQKGSKEEAQKPADDNRTVGVNKAKSELSSSTVKTLPTSSSPSSSATRQSSVKLTQIPARESDQEHCNSISREANTIKSLYRHNSFQLQIGLSLHSQKTGSSLDEEDSLADTTRVKNLAESSDLSAISLTLPTFARPSVLNCRQKSQTLPGYSTGNKPRRHRSLQKSVSFADLPMTRSKAMFVGQSRSSSGSIPPKEEDVTTQNVSTASPANSSSSVRSSTAVLDHRLSLPTDIYDHFIKKQESDSRRVKNSRSCDEIDSMFDAGIRALSLKPRKSIIAPPRRRTTVADLSSRDSRRRSVTFQPEVLLQEIVTDGDVKAVSEILESGMILDVNKMSPSGLTALHQSAIDGNLDCAKALVQKGADVNCTDCEGWTPLHAAVMNECTDFVRFLLVSGANPALKNDADETPYDMAKGRHIRKMLLHAMNGKNMDADDFSDGEYSGEEEEEYSHAESESDDDTEGDGSGLFDASMEEKKSLKERLGLTHNSALNNSSPSPDLDNVFSSSSQVQFQNRDRELTDSTSSYGSLFEPEVEERKSKLTVPKTSESDTDKISESGISTMEGSSDCSHRSRVLSSEDDEISLDSDLDPDSYDYKFQDSCLHCDVDRVLRLVKHKKEIDINRVNRTSGITALHHSVLEENFALVQHLVKDFGADIHVIDIDGWTPLHAASAVGNIQIAQFLLDKGAKASCLNSHCELPVDVAEDAAMEKLLKKFMSLKR